MVLAWAIYSGIPLIAMQYNINVTQFCRPTPDVIKFCENANVGPWAYGTNFVGGGGG